MSGFTESPPPTAEQLKEVVLLLRDLADALVWVEDEDGVFVDEVPDDAYSILDRLRPYRSPGGGR